MYDIYFEYDFEDSKGFDTDALIYKAVTKYGATDVGSGAGMGSRDIQVELRDENNAVALTKMVKKLAPHVRFKITKKVDESTLSAKEKQKLLSLKHRDRKIYETRMINAYELDRKAKRRSSRKRK